MAFKEIAYNSPVISYGVKKDFIEVDAFESGLINTICTGDSIISGFGEIENMTQVNESFMYDTFCLDYEDFRKILKISYVTGFNSLQKEHDALNALPTGFSGQGLVSPKVESFSGGNGYNYLCTTFENGYSFEDIQKADFTYNLATFCNVLDAVHESPASGLPSLQDKLNLDSSILEVDIDRKMNQELTFYYGLGINEIERIIEENTKFINENYNSSEEVFSNFAIKYSSILYKEDMIKLINFDNCYRLDLFTSLHKTICSLQLNRSKSHLMRFLKTYYNNSNLVSNYNQKSFIQKYFDTVSVNSAIILSDLFSKQLFTLINEGSGDTEKFYQNYLTYSLIKDYIQENEDLAEFAAGLEDLFCFIIPGHILSKDKEGNR